MKLFIGVDVSKNTLDIYCNNKVITVSNNQTGLTEFHSLLQQEVKNSNKIAMIVCEATGGYEKKLVKFAFSKSIPVHMAHPNKVRKYAESKGLLAKTDKIDACLLADYGEIMKVQPIDKMRTTEEEILVGLLKRREQLKEDKIREMVRLDKDLVVSSKKSIKFHIKWLEKEITTIEIKIKKIRGEHESINTKIELLKSVPSIGNITACILVAFLPELGSTAGSKKIVALAGLAPYVKESGKYKGKRFIHGGRSVVRQALYMSALTSVRHYKEMSEFYLRLRDNGKTAKIALIAVARKLLTVLNSVMYRKTAWQETCPVTNERLLQIP